MLPDLRSEGYLENEVSPAHLRRPSAEPTHYHHLTSSLPLGRLRQPAPAPAPKPQVQRLEALETLTAAEADTLEAIVARLIPSDANGPGATEARAAHYIDRALTGPLRASRGAYGARRAC